METSLYYTEASESELNDLVVGRRAGHPLRLDSRMSAPRLRNGGIGVVWREWGHGQSTVQPVVLICREDEQRRLFGRFAQLRGDVSPLTAWCHLLKPEHFDLVRTFTRDAELGGYQAAWTGLVVAEALLLSERQIGQLRLPACFATQTFAVARTKALWERIPTDEIITRFDTGHRLFRYGEPRHLNLRPFLEPIWTILSLAASSDAHGSWGEYRPIVESLRRLDTLRRAGNEIAAAHIAQPLVDLAPEAQPFTMLTELTAERRLHLFDQFILALDHEGPHDRSARRLALAFLAGYLATVVAGGGPSLSVAEESATRRPDLTAWAYVLGSVGETVIWTSSFDGLGRLVARELMRPLRLDESPTCDVALDEAKALVDPQLSDPLVHLRLKQARLATISLLPGVNVAMPLTEANAIPAPTRPQEVTRRNVPPEGGSIVRATENAMALLADLLLPHIEARLVRRLRSGMQEASSPYRGGDKRTRNRQKPSSQSGLPLDTPEESENR
jgi:hypothetical protein